MYSLSMSSIYNEYNMSQIKIYASAETIDLHRQSLSDAIHRALVEQLQYPTN